MTVQAIREGLAVLLTQLESRPGSQGQVSSDKSPVKLLSQAIEDFEVTGQLSGERLRQAGIIFSI